MQSYSESIDARIATRDIALRLHVDRAEVLESSAKAKHFAQTSANW